ncbi:glycosyltransferase family 39 protein [Patescibacteria group bacterium]|nr:glycosyltransferase family 39 protein [Patescibacteria group bacterium]
MTRLIQKTRNLIRNKNFPIYFWLFIIFTAIVFHSQHILNPDEGVLLNGAWQMINGFSLYLDIFSYVAPLGFYLIYWLWLLFGVSYLAANIFSILLLIISAFILFKSSQLIKKTYLNYLAPLIYIIATACFPLINHNFFSTFFAVISTYFFLKYINNRRGLYMVFAAIFTAITVLTLQQKGLAIAGSTIVFFFFFIDINLKKKIKHLSIYIISLLLPLLFLLRWPLDLILNNLFYFPIFNYTEANVIPLNPWIIIMVILFIIILKHYKSKRKKIYYLLLLQTVLFLSVLTLPDMYHIFLASFPLFILTPKLISIKNLKTVNEKIYLITIISFLTIIIFLPILNYNLIFKSDKEFKNDIKNIVVNKCKSDYIYAGPFVPNLYFELRKINPSPYDILLTNHHTKKQFKEAKEKIIEKQADCAILSYPSSLKRFNYNKNNIVDSYIRKNYTLISNEFGVNIYKKYE